MTKNQWDVEIVTDAEDFKDWNWDDGAYGEAYTALVNEISIEAARAVNDELVRDAMFDLRPTEDGLTAYVMLFGGNVELSYPVSTLVAEFIEGRTDHQSEKLEDAEYREEAERFATQLERAAALIRAALA